MALRLIARSPGKNAFNDTDYMSSYILEVSQKVPSNPLITDTLSIDDKSYPIEDLRLVLWPMGAITAK
jgi:hypothetical protein